MAKSFPFLSLGLLWAPCAAAGELASLQLQSTAPVTYQAPESVDIEANSMAAALAVPLAVREGLYVLPGLSYRFEAPRYIDPPDDILPVPRLHEIEVSSTVLRKADSGWSVAGRLTGGLAGDLFAVDSGVVRVSGFALAAKQVSAALELGLGGALTYEFGRLMPVPLLKLRWLPSEVFSVDALLPSHLDVTWHPQERLRLGVFGEIVGNAYAVRLPEIRQSSPCVGEDADPSLCTDHIAYTDGNVSVFSGFQVSDGVWLEARVGMSLYRRFSFRSIENTPVLGGDQALDPAPLGMVRVSWEY